MSMKRTLFTLALLAVLCVNTFAMVPKHRLTRDADKEICAPQTPCAWDVYKAPLREVYIRVDNSYCICAANQQCTMEEDDLIASAYVYKCKDKDT